MHRISHQSLFALPWIFPSVGHNKMQLLVVEWLFLEWTARILMNFHVYGGKISEISARQHVENSFCCIRRRRTTVCNLHRITMFTRIIKPLISIDFYQHHCHAHNIPSLIWSSEVSFSWFKWQTLKLFDFQICISWHCIGGLSSGWWVERKVKIYHLFLQRERIGGMLDLIREQSVWNKWSQEGCS